MKDIDSLMKYKQQMENKAKQKTDYACKRNNF